MAKIVRACREHLSEISLIESLCFSDPWSEKALELLLNESCVAFVALIDGRVAAYGGMMIVLDEGQVINIATHPDYRRQGLARDIMNALSHSACELGLGVKQRKSLRIRTTILLRMRRSIREMAWFSAIV